LGLSLWHYSHIPDRHSTNIPIGAMGKISYNELDSFCRILARYGSA
jgi:hypothetical protein